MATTTDLSTLVINYLTKAQYEAAVSGGTIDPDQLYLTPETNVPVTDVEVDGSSVVSGGVAEITLPTVPTNVSAFTNDAGYLTSYTETDPTVPSWAKASSKPSYTAAEVGAVPTSRTVNGKALSSNITLSASDVSALPSSTVIPTITDTYSGTSSNGMSGKAVKQAIDALDGTVSGNAGSGKTLTAFSQTDGKVSATFGNISITKSQVSDFPTLATVATSGDYDDLTDKPTIPTITDTYSGTSSNGMSGKAVKSAIDALDGSVSGSAGSGKTLTAFSQTNGVVSATFGNISITKSQVSDFPTIPSKTSDLQNDSGFITGYTETDPVFTASDAYGISSSDISNWDNAYDGNISFDTTAVSGDDYNLTTILTALGWLSDVIV